MSADVLPLDLPPAPVPVRLSFSKVDSYQRCPLQYKLVNIDGAPTRPSPALSWGTSLHTAIERWWTRKLPEPPPVEELLQALYEGWDDTGFAGMDREEKLRWYRHAQDVLRRHHERYAPTYLPAVASEQRFLLDLGDAVAVSGSIDHVTRTPAGGLAIVDWKTNKTARPRAAVRGSLQLAIYALAAEDLWGRAPDWVALDFVVPGLRVVVDRDEIDVDGALRTIRAVADAVRAELFPATPNRLCDWCDVRALCPAFAGEGPDVAGHAVSELRRLRRERDRATARIAQLERFVVDAIGPDAVLELG